MKIGRNDPCPCGSGKKYKNCCLNKSKIIPFPGTEGGIADKGSFGNLDEIAEMFPLEDIKETLEDYEYYCDNILREGERVPTFEEYISEKSALKEFLGVQNIHARLGNVGDIDGLSDLAGDGFTNNNDQEIEAAYQTIEEKLGDLAVTGLFGAPDVVEINKKISVGSVKATPLIMLSWAFLEFLVRNGGSVSPVRIRQQGPKVFFDILEEKHGHSNFEMNMEDKKIAELWIENIEALLSSKGYADYTDKSISVTEKGLKFLSGKNVKSAYFQLVRYLFEEIDWFFEAGLPEEFEIIQDLAGSFLLFMERMTMEEKSVGSVELVKAVDSVYRFFEHLEQVGINRNLVTKTIEKYFLKGNFFLAGLVKSLPGEREGYIVTELSRDIFKWKI